MEPNVESRISERLSALHAHFHGKRSSGARTYIAGDDVVVVVLEETFTPAEQALVDRAKRKEFRSSVGVFAE
ncbi:MAG: Na-translocating system protein MpsC family protein [Solirubrobacteraceae bacterium]